MSRRHINETITKIDKKILSWIVPCTDDQCLQYGADSYYCFASKYLNRYVLASRVKKVKNWVEKNEGIFKLLDPLKFEDIENCCYETQGMDRAVFVRIRFPRRTNRNMKEIMSVLYDSSDIKYI